MANNRKKFFQYRDIDGFSPDGDAANLAKSIMEVGLHEETVAKLQTANITKLSQLASIEMKHAYRIEKMNRKDVFAVLRVLHANKLDFKRSPNQDNADSDDAENSSADSWQKKPQRRPMQSIVSSNADAVNGSATANSLSTGGNINPNNNGTTEQKYSKYPPNSGNNKNLSRPTDNRNNQRVEGSRDNVRGAADRQPVGGESSATAMRQNVRQSRPGEGIQSSSNARVANGQRNNSAHGQSDSNNAQSSKVAPQREKVNTHDFLRGKLTDSSQRDRAPGRDKIGRDDRNNREDKTNYDKKPAVKRVIELPPLVIADGLYKFFKQGKWGYKDDGGKTIIEPSYDEAYNFSEGLAAVENNGRIGFIDTKGEMIIDFQFDTVCSFSAGLASVMKDDKCAYIKADGEYEFEYDFQAATSFIDGIALVKKDGKWGYLNRETREIRLR